MFVSLNEPVLAVSSITAPLVITLLVEKFNQLLADLYFLFPLMKIRRFIHLWNLAWSRVIVCLLARYCEPSGLKSRGHPRRFAGKRRSKHACTSVVWGNAQEGLIEMARSRNRLRIERKALWVFHFIYLKC